MNLPASYDAWRLASPYGDDLDPLGVEDGDICNRFPEPDEGAPRGYRPARCTGTMSDGWCDQCGASA